ncbi:MAG: hypothetical protein K2G53_07830 [Muribaculaceae bacterium]|nr:hypothetical protein [Muribaculaceae bacterium]
MGNFEDNQKNILYGDIIVLGQQIIKTIKPFGLFASVATVEDRDGFNKTPDLYLKPQ